MDTTNSAVYATALSGTAALAVNTKTGAATQSTATPSGDVGTVWAQDGSYLYMAVNDASGNTFIYTIAKGSMSLAELAGSELYSPTSYLWIGIMPGSAEQICAHWSGYYDGNFDNLECGLVSNGAPGGVWIDVCSPTASVPVCEMSCTVPPGTAYTTCLPGPAVAVAADSQGIVWADYFESSSNFYSLPASNLGNVHPATVALPYSDSPSLFVLDSVNAYWFDSANLNLNRTTRSNPTNTEMQNLIYTPAQLAVDSTYLYWANPTGNTIMRMPLSGTVGTSPTVLASGTGVSSPTGIAVDSTAVYWINGNGSSIMKMVLP
jgi:hypothetical protein